MKLKNGFLIIPLILLTGCATAINGTNDEIEIKSEHEKEMNCKISLDDKVKEEWIQNEKIEKITLKRQPNNLMLNCSNELESLSYEIKPKFDAEFIALNFLIDFCIVSCPLDMATGALYDYPELIHLKKESD